MTKKDFYKDKQFNSYLKKNKKDQKYEGYVRSIRNNILTKIGSVVLIDDIERIIEDKKYSERLISDLKYLNVFLSDLTRLASIGNERADKYITNTLQTTIGSVQSWNTGFSEYIIFLGEVIVGVRKKVNKYTVTEWNNAKKNLTNLLETFYASNGIEALLARFKNHEDYIKDIVKNSFFFSPELAIDRFSYISGEITGNRHLYARKSTDNNIQKNGMFCYTDDVKNVPKSIQIKIDSNGNREVVDLIEKKTGYLVSSGKQSVFQNYIISHLWGDAFDPRNFTSFWNLALVPAWGNYLLDKTDSDDELTLKAINTFKAIAIKLYKMSSSSYDWSLIGKDFKKMKPNKKYVVSGKYEIRFISEKKKMEENSIVLQDFGNINKKHISL